MPANHEQQPPKKRAAKRKGASLRAKAASSSMQPDGKRKPRGQSKPEVEPAPRIAGVKEPKPSPLSLYALSEAKELPAMTAAQRSKMLGWRDRVERLAAEDPVAYAAACRSGKQL